MVEPLLLANLGGEEPGPRPKNLSPRVAALAEAWRGLFVPPAFRWLEGAEAAAWWNDPASESAAEAAGRTLLGAPADVALRVHDKGWASAVAREEWLDPRILRGIPEVLSSEQLTSPEAPALLSAVLERWPEWARRDFTLKPRIGSSGRGRVAGRDGRITPELLGALPRLAGAGGAILEPWLDRLADASAQLSIDADGSVTLLGTLEMVVTPSGGILGHRGEFDSRGRPRSGLPEEEALREAAGACGVAAARDGYRGPCGIDAFVFEDPESRDRTFRPLVECNARFTGGIVAIGHLRRSLPTIKQRLGLAPGDLFHFYVGLDAPPGGWPDQDGGGGWFLPLLDDTTAERIGAQPGLWVHPDRSVLDRALVPAPP